MTYAKMQGIVYSATQLISYWLDQWFPTFFDLWNTQAQAKSLRNTSDQKNLLRNT